MLFLKTEKNLKLYLSLKRKFLKKDFMKSKFYKLNFKFTYLFLNARVFLYNGLKLIKITVKKDMLGHYAGEFIFPCKRVFFTLKKKKKIGKK